MRNLHDIHRAAHQEAARRADEKREREQRERLDQEERERAAQEAAERKRALNTPSLLLTEIVTQGTTTCALIADAERIGHAIEHNRMLHPELLGGSLRAKVVRMTVLFAISIGTALLDFFFLSGVASFLLSVAGVTWKPALWLGKVVVPLLVVGYELGTAAAVKKRPRSFTYLFPAIVATFATATYVAHEGITSLDAITPIHWFMIPAVFGFGFMLHYLTMCLAPYAIDGMTIATDLRQGAAYNKARQKAEAAIDFLCLKVLAWLEAYRVLKEDFKIEVTPPFYLLPALTRQLFNEKVGYSFFPDPHVGGSGDGATPPPSWTTPQTPDEDGWNSSISL